VYGDLTDWGSLGAESEGVTTVFHLGGGGTVKVSMGDYLRINVDATRNLLDAASDDPKRRAAKLVRQLQPSAIASPSRGWSPRSSRGIFTTALARSCA